MNSGLESPPAAGSNDNEQALQIYRSLAVTAAVVIPGFGIVRRIIDPGSHDPFVERVVIAAVLLVYVGLTLVNGPVRRNPHRSIAMILYLVSAGVIHMGTVNGLSVNTAFGFLILVFACSLAFRTRMMLAGYQVMAIVAIGGTVYLAPHVEIEPLFFLTSVVAVCMLTYAVQVNRLAAEAALREARDLAEAAVEARGRFLANMSHEIRTPMNGVIGMASLLEDTELTRVQRDYLRTIRTSGDGLLMLINDILDFSKIEAGHVVLEQELFDPVACAEGATAVVAPAAREKRLELICECAPDLPAEVVGDSLRLRQVLVNLLSNAVKFTARGEVHAYLHGALEGGDGYRLYCSVRDTGIGIAAASAEGLFRAFAQADSSTTRRFGGTGLGLTICRQLVERMGGRIRIESREGHGATFHFDVHLGRGERRPALPAPLPENTRVLLIEPNATVRTALARRLRAWNLGCDAIADEDAAAQALTERSYEVVMAGCSSTRFETLTGCLTSRAAAPMMLRLAPMVEPPADAGARQRTFTVYRPLRVHALREALQGGVSARGEAVEAIPHAGDTQPASGLRILLAEDNPVNQRVALKMFERLGHHARLVSDGAEALAAVREGSYDVVFMDLQMPVMDGLEATRCIREMPGGESMHIVAMTANAMRSDRDACLAAGMNDCLCKPVRIDELRALLAPLAGQAEAANNTSSVMSSSISKNECSSVART